MRIGIVRSASRLTFFSSVLLIALSTGTGCNAVVDFGGKIGSDDYRKDAGARDGGGEPERDGGGEPERDGGGEPERDGSTPSDASTSDAEVSDGGRDGATTDPDANMSCESTTEDCSNDADDDCDGMRDCRDSDCFEAAICCKPNQIPETSCTGGIDNDCDGEFDCEDSDCASTCCTASGPEVGAIPCTDTRDNDCDGLVDCAELACAGQASCCDATGDENNAAACMDGNDNDCDLKKDCLDPDCAITTACCTPAGASETNCTDDVDNDCDGNVDCKDAECSALAACSCTATSSTETSCTDSVDNDCDRDRDCRDRDCEGNLACCINSGAENTSSACIDGTDNDCDGFVDCDDPDCRGQLSCCIVAPENSAAACMDNTDNDCDSKLDCSDESCQGTTSCCVRSGDENNPTSCADNVDNDCDGLLNCSDPDCAGIAACPCASGGSHVLGIGCCTPDGMTEKAAPNDGKDNDCDGLIDIPILNTAFPIEGLPAAGNEVSLRFAPEINPNATLQCRSKRVSSATAAVWGPCRLEGSVVKPFDATASSKPENNGVWQTEVRWSFPGGGVSDVHTFRYYIHNTLHGVQHCTSAHSDADWFAKAATRLATPDAGSFRLNQDTFLANPFVRVLYQTPASSRDTFYLDGSAVGVDMWSLRKRFKLSSNNKYLLITRNYRATRTGSCGAGTLSIHNNQRGMNDTAFNTYGCDAIVLNRAGAGVCMVNGTAGMPGPQFPPNTDQNDWYANNLGWDKANKFMWRIYVDSSSTGRLNFTPKCAQMPCSGGAIFLPDKALFTQ